MCFWWRVRARLRLRTRAAVNDPRIVPMLNDEKRVYRDPAGGFTVGLSGTWVLSRAGSLPVLNELQADEINAGWILWSELLPKLPASRFQFHLINSGGHRRAIRIDALAIAGPSGGLLPWFHPQDRFALAGLDAVNRRDQPPPLKRICHRETLLANRTQGKCPQE